MIDDRLTLTDAELEAYRQMALPPCVETVDLSVEEVSLVAGRHLPRHPQEKEDGA